jgi:spore maturation protein CgeB
VRYRLNAALPELPAPDLSTPISTTLSRRTAPPVLLFPNAADTQRYDLRDANLAGLRDPARYEYDVSFFGAMDGKRYKEMRARQEFFAALGERLQERGIRFLFRESSGMSVEEQVALVQTSRINLNFGASCDYGSSVASGLPERCCARWLSLRQATLRAIFFWREPGRIDGS